MDAPNLNNAPLVYVAGPLTVGLQMPNIRKAVGCGDEIAAMGCGVFIPHLNSLWDFAIEHDYEYWMFQDMVVLLKCDALFRMPGESAGADREVKMAMERGIPVFYDLEKLKDWVALSG